MMPGDKPVHAHMDLTRSPSGNGVAAQPVDGNTGN